MSCSNRDTLPRDLSIMTLMKSRALIQISFHPTVSSKIKTENTLKFHGILFSLDLWPHCKLCWESTIEAKHIFKSELELYVLISLEFRLKLGSSPLRSYSHLKPVFFAAWPFQKMKICICLLNANDSRVSPRSPFGCESMTLFH